MADRPPYAKSRTITPGTPVAEGAGVVIACSVAGIVNLIMRDGTILPIYAVVGTSALEGYAITGVQAAGTTATATVSAVS